MTRAIKENIHAEPKSAGQAGAQHGARTRRLVEDAARELLLAKPRQLLDPPRDNRLAIPYEQAVRQIAAIIDKGRGAVREALVVLTTDLPAGYTPSPFQMATRPDGTEMLTYRPNQPPKRLTRPSRPSPKTPERPAKARSTPKPPQTSARAPKRVESAGADEQIGGVR